MMDHRGVRSKIDEGGGGFLGSAIGHRRLPIVGIGEENDQPVYRGKWTVAFVGEILDFRERRPGDESDIDLVADTWDKQGPCGFRSFDGFWSVVARDNESGSIYGLVDYLCQKPLFVRHDFHATAIASEPDAVAVLGPIEFDRTYFSAVAKWGYCPETWRTPYTTIRKMLPGEHVVLREGKDPEYSIVDRIRPVNSSIPNLRAEIVNAVRRRVQSSDVPVACLVSGGLDSAITYKLAQDFGSVRPYHVENDEWEACLRIAPESTRLDCARTSLLHALDYMQEPLDLGSLVPQVAMSDSIASSGKESVCLTGDGADELFGGYSRASRYDSQSSDVFHELVGWHLPRLDRVMMRNRIEVRSPFLARKVVEIALGLPRDLRIDKKVLRELFRGDLAPQIVDSKKKALRTPEVAEDRIGRSVELIELFKKRRRLCP